VGGPACEYRISQGLLKEKSAAVPWILDPTAAGSCGCGGLRRLLGARVHGGPPIQKRRGMRSEPPVQDPTALDARVRDAAATSPECGSVRRDLAGVAPGRCSRPLARPQDSSKRRGDACARDRGVKGGDCASPAAGAGRGRSGRSGELASALLCTKGRGNGLGLLLTIQRRSGRARR
jgi:hypothetical protein